MADAPDSKSGRGNPVRVQVPPPAPLNSPHLTAKPISTVHTYPQHGATSESDQGILRTVLATMPDWFCCSSSTESIAVNVPRRLLTQRKSQAWAVILAQTEARDDTQGNFAITDDAKVRRAISKAKMCL